MLSKVFALSALVSATYAAQATTTHYYDGTLGACGCGTVFDSYIYTAAGSQALFGSGTWCGSGCGACYSLESTGSAPPSQGTGGGAGTSIMVVITNLCPYAGNEVWCPNAGSTNQYGYSAHFDINSASGNGQFDSLGWNNPIVNYSPVACPSSVTSHFSSCECPMNGGSGVTNPPPPTSSSTSSSSSSTKKTTSTSTTTPSGGSGSGTAAHWAQCGGQGYNGPTTCAAPYTCTYSNAYYSQCL